MTGKIWRFWTDLSIFFPAHNFPSHDKTRHNFPEYKVNLMNNGSILTKGIFLENFKFIHYGATTGEQCSNWLLTRAR